MTPAVLEVAEAMYRAAADGPGPKMPETLAETAPHTQKRYLLLAEAAAAACGSASSPRLYPATEVPVVREALDVLAEELAWAMNHPMGGLSERTRTALDLYVEIRGDANLNPEIAKAREIWS